MFYWAIAFSTALNQVGAIDDHQATVSLNRFAHKLGIDGLKVETRERASSPVWNSAKGSVPLEIVGCVAIGGRKYACTIAADSEVVSFVKELSGEEGTFTNVKPVAFDPGHPPKDYDPRPVGERVMKCIDAKGPYEYRPMRVPNSTPEATAAVFDLTIAGHRFFGLEPNCSYMVFLNLKTSEVLGVKMPAHLPAVNATSPKIDEGKARDLLTSWSSSNKGSDSGAMMLQLPKSSLEMELGYYKFKDQPKATLVWEGRVARTTSNGFRVDPMCLGMLVDATTGEFIAPDQNALIN